MILADGGISILWVAGILLVGCLSLLVMLLVAVGRLVRWVLWLVFAPFRRRRSLPGPPPPIRVQRRCPQPRCGHVNPPGARYCGRCGGALRPVNNVDRYG